MIYFHNDYSEGCHEKVLEALIKTNMEQTPGYGEDAYCRAAAQKIRAVCGNDDLAVHFLVGGTQTNAPVISPSLRPFEGVLAAETAHIAVHETGAIEHAGHKVLTLPTTDGKITAEQVSDAMEAHLNESSFEHTVRPAMVYISFPTELGTIYSKAELTALRTTCDKYGLQLFLDGARLGYGLAARSCDVTMSDIARLTDVFYIGGTKVGALFGEAVVIRNKELNKDSRSFIKEKGGMLAKGRLLGLQFETLIRDGLYAFKRKEAINMGTYMMLRSSLIIPRKEA